MDNYDNYAANNSTPARVAEPCPDYRMQDWAQKTGSSTTLQKSQPIRERIQDALKRASQLTSNLSFLADNVAPQSQLNDAKGLAGTEFAEDSTLTSEVGDLLRELGRIEHQVQRLSLAITG